MFSKLFHFGALAMSLFPPFHQFYLWHFFYWVFQGRGNGFCWLDRKWFCTIRFSKSHKFFNSWLPLAYLALSSISKYLDLYLYYNIFNEPPKMVEKIKHLKCFRGHSSPWNKCTGEFYGESYIGSCNRDTPRYIGKYII